MTDVLHLTKKLIARQSITPDDQGCQQIIAEELQAVGFQIRHLRFGKVDNMFAWHGHGEPCLLFVGHTDVVPPGPLAEWQNNPFEPTEKEGYLYGRGAADMKSGVAAMTLAMKEFIKQNPQHKGRIGLVLTSDEEGPAVDGVVKVVEYLKEQKIIPHYIIVGEASSNERLGDVIKIGRRGSMHMELTIMGKQGHIAYPLKADNPIHRCFKPLNALAEATWDQGNEFFSPTSFQFYDIQSGIGADNVIPPVLTAKFNFRFAPPSTPESLQAKVAEILDTFEINYTIKCHVSCRPYFSGECQLSRICQQAIQTICGVHAVPNTVGGSSDGRHFADFGSQIVELGPVNKTIHKINECTHIAELSQLQHIYQEILRLLFSEDR